MCNKLNYNDFGILPLPNKVHTLFGQPPTSHNAPSRVPLPTIRAMSCQSRDAFAPDKNSERRA